MPGNGNLQVFKVSSAEEAAYGEDWGTPTMNVIGIVDDGEIGGRIENAKYFGIGSPYPQAQNSKRFEGMARASILSPTAAILNLALVRTALNELKSYKIGAGISDGTAGTQDAWAAIGAKVNTMTIDIPEDDSPIKASQEWWFKEFVADKDLAGHVPGDVNLWTASNLIVSTGNGGGGYTVDGDFVSGSININNNLERKGTAMGNASSGRKKVFKYMREGDLDISLTLNTYKVPSFGLTDDCPLRDVKVKFVFTDPCEATPPTLTIELTGGIHLQKIQPIKPNQYIDFPLELSFSGIEIS